MTDEQQLKLQAFLDGELTAGDVRAVEAWLARDSAAAALLSELQHTRSALAGFERPETAGASSTAAAVKCPESREFYWSKIKREIERTTPAAGSAPVRTESLFARLRRTLIPLSAAAVLAIVGLVTLRQYSAGDRAIAVNSMLADAGAFTYRDEAQGMTVVWLSYPAENKFAQKSSGVTLSPK